MGRRNRPKQGDPEPLFEEDRPSGSKTFKRKAADEGSHTSKRTKGSSIKGKGKQQPINGVRAQKRARQAVAAAAAKGDDGSESSAAEENEDGEANLEAHKKCANVYSFESVHILTEVMYDSGSCLMQVTYSQ